MENIIEQAFTFQALNPSMPTDQYKVWNQLSKSRRKQVDWALSLVAQKELAKVDLAVSSQNADTWIYQFSRECPEAEIAILKHLIEPITPNAVGVEALYWADSLDLKFVEGISSGFTMSSSSRVVVSLELRIKVLEAELLSLQTKSTESSENTENPIEPIKTSTEVNEKQE
jgi:hypothetical protein